MDKRGSGILLHLSSLPSDYGIGDLGPGAHKFVDFLRVAKQRYWQVLPLNPTNPVNGNSPYNSISAFAFNPILISPELILDLGLLKKSDLSRIPEFDPDFVDYEKVHKFKDRLVDLAFENFQKKKKTKAYSSFCKEQEFWLEDFAAFCCFKRHFDNRVWREWPEDIAGRKPKPMAALKKKLKTEIEKEKFTQFLFFQQWQELKKYANQNKVEIIGDIPIYVTYDSVDVWAHQSIFQLDEFRMPICVAGVPPDYFSKTGQLWGNPVYDWEKLKSSGYDWWEKRVAHNLRLFDWVRIDHFRGFVDFWAIPAREQTAINGTWKQAPARDFFTHLKARFPRLPVIAEDLGIITDEVRDVIRHFSFPNMKILMFAFGEDLHKHPYLPHNYPENCVAYTGTHDNNTVQGWFSQDISEPERRNLREYFKQDIPADILHWVFIEILMHSPADMAIFPMQDVLGLDQNCRMNIPGKAMGNWKWRMSFKQIAPEIRDHLEEFTLESHRGV